MHRLSYTTSLNRHTQFTALHMFPRNATPSGKRTVSLPSSLRILKSEAGKSSLAPLSKVNLSLAPSLMFQRVKAQWISFSALKVHPTCFHTFLSFYHQVHIVATTDHMREAEQTLVTGEPTVHRVTIAPAAPSCIAVVPRTVIAHGRALVHHCVGVTNTTRNLTRTT